VERYLRESFVPRLAPVSRVSSYVLQNREEAKIIQTSSHFVQEMIMNYVAENSLGLPRSY